MQSTHKKEKSKFNSWDEAESPWEEEKDGLMGKQLPKGLGP